MNSIFEKYKWLKYVLGGFIIALGILVIILACMSLDKIAVIINIVIAISLLLIGLLLLVTNILYESHKGFSTTLLFSALILTTGIAMLVARFGLKIVFDNSFVVYLLSLATLVFGALLLIKGVSLIVYKENKTLILLIFFVGIVALVGGILGLCFAKQIVAATYIILGILLVAAGVLFLVFTTISKKKKEQA